MTIDLHCAHHESHETRTVHVSLDGQPAVPDFPPIPRRLALEFELDIWDADRYENTEGYCPGDDTVSRSIYAQGIWEGFETLLALDILDLAPGRFVDVGSQVGWYSTIAAAMGHDVLALDGDVQCAVLTSRNLERHPDVTWQAMSQTFDLDDPASMTPLGPVALMKVDIEGQELAALRAFHHGFESKETAFALVEVTPSWGLDAAVAVLDQMLAWGYGAYIVPDKGYPRLDQFADEPLGETLRMCRLAPEAARRFLARTEQTNLLFAP